MTSNINELCDYEYTYINKYEEVHSSFMVYLYVNQTIVTIQNLKFQSSKCLHRNTY